MTKADGGPAFPGQRGGDEMIVDCPIRDIAEYEDHEGGACWPGLTKREWFAGQALAGLLANSSIDNTIDDECGLAVTYADALLAELAKEAK